MWPQLISAGASVLNALKPAAPMAPAGPTISGAGGFFSGMDSSGWTVATSGSTATATAGDRGGLASPISMPPPPDPIMLPDGTIVGAGSVTPPGAVQLGAYMPYIVMGAGVLVLVLLLKK